MLDFFILALMAVGIFNGFRKGVLVTLFKLGAFIILLLFSSRITAFVAQHWYPGPHKPLWVPFIANMLVIVGVFFLGRVLARFASTLVSASGLGIVNRSLGAALGLFQVCFIVSTLTMLAVYLGIASEADVAAHPVVYSVRWVAPIVFKMFSLFSPTLGELVNSYTGKI